VLFTLPITGMHLNRSTVIPAFLDFPKYYLLVGPGVPQAPSTATQLARHSVEVPPFQRGIEWGAPEVEQLLDTKSATLGTVILASVDGHPQPMLVDGLQRFAVGTALLAELYPEVLAQPPRNRIAAANFVRLQADAGNFQPVFQTNSDVLTRHPRRAISTSYAALLQDVRELVTRELNTNPAAFSARVVRLFLDRQIGIDQYSGFTAYSELTSTFIDINTQGLDLSPTDLLRAQLVEQGLRLNWRPAEIQDMENDFTDVFGRSPQAHLRTLGKYLNSAIEEPALRLAILPNWQALTKADVAELLTFVDGTIQSAQSGAFPYLGESYACGPQAFSLVVIFYWLLSTRGRGKADFAGGRIASANDCHQLLRATYRRVIDGTIFRIESAIDWLLANAANATAGLLADQIAQGTTSGSLASNPDRGWLEQSLRRADLKRSRRVFNACLLPVRSSVGGPFPALGYGRGARDWTIDHLIPQVNVAPARVGENEAYLLTNLAPLPSSVNKAARNADCRLKLGPGGSYTHYADKHPYIDWLVNRQYSAVRPVSQLDDQSLLAPGAVPSIGDDRVRMIADLLEDRL
jgi:hypothetical protein